MRARMALKLAKISYELREVLLKDKPEEMLALSPKGTVPVLQFNDKILDESLDIINWAFTRNPDWRFARYIRFSYSSSVSGTFYICDVRQRTAADSPWPSSDHHCG